MNYLIVPGWQNSEEGHWQTYFQEKLKCPKVNQDEWFNISRESWVNRLMETVKNNNTDIIIAHSMGVHTTIISALERGLVLKGAMLVCPVDVDLQETPPELKNFKAIPEGLIKFPTLVVASESDPYCTLEKAKTFSSSWGSEFLSIGKKGHINISAGFGSWDEGLEILESFVKKI